MKNPKSVQEAISRYNLTTKQVFMFYIGVQEYIISYKLMRQIQTLVGLNIDLFTHIYVEIIYNMVKDFNMHRCALDFDSLFLSLLVK